MRILRKAVVALLPLTPYLDQNAAGMKKIAIIGGGIAGISCAISLLEEGYQADIFEQANEIREIGAVLAVMPNGMAIMKSFGLDQEILTKGGEIKTFIVRKPSGESIWATEYAYDHPCVVIRRSDLLNALLTRVDRQKIFTAHRLISYMQMPGGKVVLNFENGNTTEYDALIGADGLNSIVRKQLTGNDGLIYRGYPLWRGVGRVSNPLTHSSETWGELKRVGLYPIQDNWVGWWAAIDEPDFYPEDHEASKKKLLENFKDWHSPIYEVINSTEHIIKNAILDRVPYKKWFDGQVAMIGDAAHCTTPNLGQGANMAMESAVVLARCIGRYGPGPEAYRKYEDLRFKRTRDINRQSLLAGRIGSFKSPVATFIRNSILRTLPKNLLNSANRTYYNYDANKINIV